MQRALGIASTQASSPRYTERKDAMKRKPATKPNGVDHPGACRRLGAEAGVVEQQLRQGGSFALMPSAARESRASELPFTASTRWIAWWLNLRLD